MLDCPIDGEITAHFKGWDFSPNAQGFD